jgi:hypothetical protein
VIKKHKKNEIKKMKKVRQKKYLRSKKWSRSRKNEFTWKKWLIKKKKAKRSQSSKKTRKNLKIQTSISQKTFLFCNYRAEIFDFNANICYFEEFNSFNARNSSSQFYIFLRKFFVRINEVLKRFWKMKMSWERKNAKNFKRLLILYRDDERINFSNIKRRFI